ncbi:MAG: hypothetical protein JNK38_18615 [Acidobacteria bacterium]|nr:hypothetical protein [Acidobacteriota bacterium]
MSNFSYNSELFTRYLLGQLHDAEQDRLEEEYFCNNEVFVALLDAKDQLISNYLNGRLTAEDRKRFEQHFLTLPGHKREVELACSFLSPAPKPQLVTNRITSDRKPSTKKESPHGFRKTYQPWILAAAAMLLIGSIIALQVRKERQQATSPEVQIAAIQLPKGPPNISLFLKPTSSRSFGQDITAKIGKETQIVELKLEVSKETFPIYRGTLHIKGKEDEVLSDDSLHATKNEAGTPIVIWRLPAAKLQIEDYTASLQGIAPGNPSVPIGDYDFEVRALTLENSQQSR